MSHFGGPADAVEQKALALGGILAEYLIDGMRNHMDVVDNIPLKHLRNLISKVSTYVSIVLTKVLNHSIILSTQPDW